MSIFGADVDRLTTCCNPPYAHLKGLKEEPRRQGLAAVLTGVRLKLSARCNGQVPIRSMQFCGKQYMIGRILDRACGPYTANGR